MLCYNNNVFFAVNKDVFHDEKKSHVSRQGQCDFVLFGTLNVSFSFNILYM